MKPLYRTVYEDLLTKIRGGQYAAGDLLPTEAELCAQYGVSRITASHALNELKAQGYVERKKRKGTEVLPLPFAPRGGEQSIAVVFGGFEDFGQKIAGALAPYARKKGCLLMTFDSRHSQQREREILQYLLTRNVRGLILWPVTRASNLDLLNEFAQAQIPLCFLDYPSYGFEAPCVSSDNYGGMYGITAHLAELGHRHIAYFPFKDNFLPTEQERFGGYCAALVKNGAVLDPAFFLRDPDGVRAATTESGRDLARCAYHAVRTLLALRLRPTAVVCVNDATALHFIRAARAHGLRVPEDLSVTGFDNLALAAQNEITTVSQDFGEMAKTALNMILRQLAEPSLINNYAGTGRIRSVIIERGSVRRLS